jgi:predicted site-specific integrase-resolvase
MPTDLKKRKISDDLNTSLGEICNSMEMSFHGRRAQTKSEKKKQ